jgi:Amt family ammonium transporter
MIKRSMGVLILMSALCAPLAHADDPSGTASGAASDAATASSAAAAEASTAASAAPALTAPALVSADKLSAGDTAWMLTSTALVLMMCVPGLALFYGGMVRKKNVLATLMQSFACTCVVTILWWVIGYSWAFTPGNHFIGSSARALFNGMKYIHDDAGSKLTVSHLAPTIPETVYAMFQMTFAIITPALIAGAFADRMKFSAMLIFLSAWSLFVYAPIAHMVWEPTGWLNAAGVLDYAGGTVVHINAGIAGLASCLWGMDGRRCRRTI